MSEKWISCWKICKEDSHPSPHPHWIAESEWAIHFFQPIEPFLATTNIMRQAINDLISAWISPKIHLKMIEPPWIIKPFFKLLNTMSACKTTWNQKKRDFPWMRIWILKPTGECTLIHIAKAKSGWMWGRFVGPDTASDGLALIIISTLIIPISACYYSELRSAITI